MTTVSAERILTDLHDDIQNGLIGVVMVKDQSRFGRSYIEVGMYVERFKEMGVRFIAVDNGYDSMQSDYDMMFPMRNVINEYYAREASKKTKSAKMAKARAGQFIGSKPPFGYKPDPNDRHHLIVDEPAAEVVRRIFQLAAQGTGYNKTAKIFREEKVLTTIAYFNLHNPDYFKSDYWRKEFDWHVTSIRAILENEVYLGKLVYGKKKNKSMKSKLKVKNDRKDWIVADDCHEAIISRELWDRAHKMLESKRRTLSSEEVQMFAGLVYCASHYITYDTLYTLVFCDIQKIIFDFRSDKERFRKFLDSSSQNNSEKKIEHLEKELRQKLSRIEDVEKVIGKLYEDYALGKITESRYRQMITSYEKEENEILNELIEKIVVHHKEKSYDSRTFQQIGIYYRFVEKIGAEVQKAA